MRGSSGRAALRALLGRPCDAAAAAPAAAQQQLRAAFASKPPGSGPSPGSPTAAAQAAANPGRPPAAPTASPPPSGPTAGAAPTAGAPGAGSSGGGGGGGWTLPLLAVAAGGGYLAYQQQQQQSPPWQQQQQRQAGDEQQGAQKSAAAVRQQLDGVQQTALDLVKKGRAAVEGLLPSSLFGGGGSTSSSSKSKDAAKTAPPPAGSSSSDSDRLAQQKQHDAQELGFQLLPPGADDDGAGGDHAAASTAAARDSLSAAADEFPGLTDAAGAGAAASHTDGGDAGAAEPVHVDVTPITALFADITGVLSPSAPAAGGCVCAMPNAPSATHREEGVQQQRQVQGPLESLPLSPHRLPHDTLSPLRLLRCCLNILVGMPPAAAAGASSSKPPPAAAASKAAARKTAAAAPSEDAAEKLLAGLAAVGQHTAAAAAAAAPSGSSSSSSGAPTAKEVAESVVERLCKKLGLGTDPAPAALVAAANKAGLGVQDSGGHPVSPQLAQQRQAAADARLLGQLLQEVGGLAADLQRQLDAARQEKAWSEEAAQKSEVALTEHFKELLREQSRIGQELTAAAVAEAEARVMADAASAQLAERRQRAGLIDELRAKVNSLAVAFDQRTAQLRSAQDVNRVSLSLLALSKALEEGRPVAQQLQSLAASCPDDPVIEAVAASLPDGAADGGLPTTAQLQARFASVAAAAQEAAYFPADGSQGGVLAHLVAKLAAALKVDAGAAVDNAVDSELSRARALVRSGQMFAAADAVTAAAQGTQAAAVVQEWVADARARARADQAIRVLQARASAVASAGA